MHAYVAIVPFGKKQTPVTPLTVPSRGNVTSLEWVRLVCCRGCVLWQEYPVGAEWDDRTFVFRNQEVGVGCWSLLDLANLFIGRKRTTGLGYGEDSWYKSWLICPPFNFLLSTSSSLIKTQVPCLLESAVYSYGVLMGLFFVLRTVLFRRSRFPNLDSRCFSFLRTFVP